MEALSRHVFSPEALQSRENPGTVKKTFVITPYPVSWMRNSYHDWAHRCKLEKNWGTRMGSSELRARCCHIRAMWPCAGQWTLWAPFVNETTGPPFTGSVGGLRKKSAVHSELCLAHSRSSKKEEKIQALWWWEVASADFRPLSTHWVLRMTWTALSGLSGITEFFFLKSRTAFN